MTTSKKTCFKCTQELSLDSFYKHSGMKDGRLNKCKDCARGDVRQHRRSPKYREKVLAYDRARGNRQGKQYRLEHRKKNEKEYKARTKLANAVRDKKISKAVRCEHCGSESPLHGHHHDYDKPLSVIWLCVSCHRQIHSFMDLVANAETRSGKLSERSA